MFLRTLITLPILYSEYQPLLILPVYFYKDILLCSRSICYSRSARPHALRSQFRSTDYDVSVWSSVSPRSTCEYYGNMDDTHCDATMSSHASERFHISVCDADTMILYLDFSQV